MDERITVTQKQLASAIAGWIRGIPKRVWEQFIEHQILAHYKRSSREAVRLEGEVADHVAAEMTRLQWEVSYPAPTAPFRNQPSLGEKADDQRQGDEGSRNP